MEPGPLRNIPPNIVVTVEALHPFGLSLKGRVAGSAIVFDLGVRTRKRTRRNQTLHDTLRAARRRGHQSKACRQEKPNQGQPVKHQYMCTATMCRITAATIRTNNGKCSRCHKRSSLS